MMTKNKSKKMNELKYLVLIPVLASMLFYTSCSEKEKNQIAEKETITYYPEEKFSNFSKKWQDKRLTYMDVYHGRELPLGEEIDYSDLSELEKEEFIHQTMTSQKMGVLIHNQVRIIKPKDKRKLIVYTWKGNLIEDDGRDNSYTYSSNSLLLPTFPGCKKNDEKCFINGVKKHFFKHFNSEVTKKLDLPKGKLKLNLNFTIANDGNIVYPSAKASKKELLTELERVINLLPKMIPGEKEGKKVAVKYSLPIAILID